MGPPWAGLCGDHPDGQPDRRTYPRAGSLPGGVLAALAAQPLPIFGPGGDGLAGLGGCPAHGAVQRDPAPQRQLQRLVGGRGEDFGGHAAKAWGHSGKGVSDGKGDPAPGWAGNCRSHPGFPGKTSSAMGVWQRAALAGVLQQAELVFGAGMDPRPPYEAKLERRAVPPTTLQARGPSS